jgi:mono/diheme cytochrome c family protein
MRLKHTILTGLSFCLCGILIFTRCTNSQSENLNPADSASVMAKANFNGYETEEKYGEHLVMIGGCGDCHTPKKMTDHGPVLDSSLNLSGHPANMPAPPVDRKDLESKGVAATQTLTCWVGPWGVSYAANLTSDPTGLGGWTFETFKTAIRHGKFKGIESGRPLMPPMPWESIRTMSDDELKAVFAYLKSTTPIKNVVPEYQPPVLAASHP